MYKNLDKDSDKLIQYWKDIDLLNLTYSNRSDGPKFVFYEGPPTANGKPGIHHVIGRALKDSILRYKSMQGHKILRKAGWDTHGLPVEIEVEKKLGLKNKQEIEDYGMQKFIGLCKESVFEYAAHWRKMTDDMGYLIDLDNPYITLENDYIETVWWLLDKFNKEGLIYDGHKIQPYCARCGTGLASHEVAQGYQEIKTLSVYVKFKRSDADEYFLVWTTTPWTLPSNVSLSVHPDVDYVKIMHKGEKCILAQDLLNDVIEGEYEILESFKGRSLEHIKYEQILPFVKPDKEAFYVTLADYVTTTDGTGIVHNAPAFGEDDYQTGQRYGLPVIQPVGLDGKFTQTPWEGKFVMDADPDIIDYLGKNGSLYRKQKIDHNYPHCWRCKSPLIYFAKRGWFIKMTEIKQKLIDANNDVKWHPSFTGEKRFGNWLESLNDWAISRSRYWGTPLNIWKCSCGHYKTIASREELRAEATGPVAVDIDLHRPYVDQIRINCKKCGADMERVSDVIDCWFDSGAMPFAQYHYPFENKDLFEDQFPADFICEAIDQTRGWFYSLLAISTFVMGKAPYKNVLVNDLVLDRTGKKMSKSLGNSIDVFELFDEVGADAARWYLFYSTPAWVPTKFDKDALLEIWGKFYGTLTNLYNFFILYANTDNVRAEDIKIEYSCLTELDQWLISKRSRLEQFVANAMDNYEHMKAVRAIQHFVVEDMSNWYIRRSRRRFWGSEMNDDKKAVYKTSYDSLVSVSKLIAPFVPFVAEDIYMSLTGEKSVHLCDFPLPNPDFINDRIESRMDLVKELVSLGRAARESVKIKVRQPLGRVIIDGRHEELISDLVGLIKEELNVKDVLFENDLPKFMSFDLKPNFKVLGPELGAGIKEFSGALSALDQGEYAGILSSGGEFELEVSGRKVICNSENIIVRINAKEGYTVRLENNNFIILDTALDEALISEGYAREVVSKLQQRRKALDFDMMDNISIHYYAEGILAESIDEHRAFIMSETLTNELVMVNDDFDMEDMHIDNCNGKEIKYLVRRM